MSDIKPIVNKVAQKAIISLDLADYFPKAEEMDVIDLKDFLFKGLILKEAEFRQQVKDTDWSKYTGRYVALYCSVNAIIPMWAYMVITAELNAYAKDVACSHPDHALEIFLYRNLAALDMEQFKAQRVVIKGCGDRAVPEAAFVQLTKQLAGVARSIMYGEPCSMVPVFKKVLE
ncbi:MAG: DUF2480 family protein [Chitinophagales bacterium]